MKGFSNRNLYKMKQFYLFYTQENTILHQLSAKLENTENKNYENEFGF
jgi:hypothetical protein